MLHDKEIWEHQQNKDFPSTPVYLYLSRTSPARDYRSRHRQGRRMPISGVQIIIKDTIKTRL